MSFQLPRLENRNKTPFIVLYKKNSWDLLEIDKPLRANPQPKQRQTQMV